MALAFRQTHTHGVWLEMETPLPNGENWDLLNGEAVE